MIHASGRKGGILLSNQNEGGGKALAEAFGLKLPEDETVRNYTTYTTVELSVVVRGPGAGMVRLLVRPEPENVARTKCRDCDNEMSLVYRADLLNWHCDKCGWLTGFDLADTDRPETAGLIVGEHSSRRVWFDGEELLPGPSQETYNHSPDGFAWGYAGSGPAQLALAVSLRLCPKKADALLVYQAFKSHWLAKLDKERDFCVPVLGVQGWLDLAIQKARRGEREPESRR